MVSEMSPDMVSLDSFCIMSRADDVSTSAASSLQSVVERTKVTKYSFAVSMQQGRLNCS